MDLAQDRYKCYALVNAFITLRVPQNKEKVSTS